MAMYNISYFFMYLVCVNECFFFDVFDEFFLPSHTVPNGQALGLCFGSPVIYYYVIVKSTSNCQR